MSTDTILTPEEIGRIAVAHGCDPDLDDGALVMRLCRATEQAVLQSPEVQELRQRVEDMEKIVAECRDAVPIPNVGSKAEMLWPDAMSDAAAVPDFIKASIESMRKDAERYRSASKPESDGAVDICICRVNWETGTKEVLTGDRAHTAIDAAMEKQK